MRAPGRGQHTSAKTRRVSEPDPHYDSPSLSERIAHTIAAVPSGRVATYGQVAALAGNPRAARQVVRILNAWSRSRGLPWHRIVNRHGTISLPDGEGGDLQRTLLESEGIEFDRHGRIDLERFGF